jgi:hypothetical protein
MEHLLWPNSISLFQTVSIARNRGWTYCAALAGCSVPMAVLVPSFPFRGPWTLHRREANRGEMSLVIQSARKC